MSHNSSQQKHDCRVMLRKVMMSLDGELTEQEEKQFLTDINNCSSCLEKFSIEKSFKEFLCTKISRKTVSPAVIASIREQVKNISPE